MPLAGSAALLRATLCGDAAEVARLVHSGVAASPLRQFGRRDAGGAIAASAAASASGAAAQLERVLRAHASAAAAMTWEPTRSPELSPGALLAAMRPWLPSDRDERRQLAAQLSALLDDDTIAGAPGSALAAALCIIDLLRQQAPPASSSAAAGELDDDDCDEFDPLSTAASWLSPGIEGGAEAGGGGELGLRVRAGLAMAVAAGSHRGLSMTGGGGGGGGGGGDAHSQQQQLLQLRERVEACLAADGASSSAAHALALCAAAAAADGGGGGLEAGQGGAGALLLEKHDERASLRVTVLEPALLACGASLEWGQPPAAASIPPPVCLLVTMPPPRSQPAVAAVSAAGGSTPPLQSALEAGRALGHLAASTAPARALHIHLRGSAFGLPSGLLPEDRVDVARLEVPLSAACCAVSSAPDLEAHCDVLQRRARALAFALGAASVAVRTAAEAYRVVVLRRSVVCTLQQLHEAASSVRSGPSHATDAAAAPSSSRTRAGGLAAVDHDDVMAVVGLKARRAAAAQCGHDSPSDADAASDAGRGSDDDEAQLRSDDDGCDGATSSSSRSDAGERRGASGAPRRLGGMRQQQSHRRPRFDVMAALEQIQSSPPGGGQRDELLAATLQASLRRVLAWVSDACESLARPTIARGLSLPPVLVSRLVVMELDTTGSPASLPAATLLCELLHELLEPLQCGGSEELQARLRQQLDAGLPAALVALSSTLVPLLEAARRGFAAAVASYDNSEQRRHQVELDGGRLRRAAVREAVGRVEASLRLGGRFADHAHAAASARAPVWTAAGVGAGSAIASHAPPAGFLRLRDGGDCAAEARPRVASLTLSNGDQDDALSSPASAGGSGGDDEQPTAGAFSRLPAVACPAWLEECVTVAYGEGLLQATLLTALQLLCALASHVLGGLTGTAAAAAAVPAAAAAAAAASGGDPPAPTQALSLLRALASTPARQQQQQKRQQQQQQQQQQRQQQSTGALLDLVLAHLQRCCVSTSHAAVCSQLCNLAEAAVALAGECDPPPHAMRNQLEGAALRVRMACAFSLFSCPAHDTLPDARLTRALLREGAGAVCGELALSAPVLSSCVTAAVGAAAPWGVHVVTTPSAIVRALLSPAGPTAQQWAGGGAEGVFAAQLAELVGSASRLSLPRQAALLTALSACVSQLLGPKLVPGAVAAPQSESGSSSDDEAQHSGGCPPGTEMFRHPVFELVCLDNALLVLAVLLARTAGLARHLGELLMLPEADVPPATKRSLAGGVPALYTALQIAAPSVPSAWVPDVVHLLRGLLALLRCNVALACSLTASDLGAAPMTAQEQLACAVAEELLPAAQAIHRAASGPDVATPLEDALCAALAQLSAGLHAGAKAIDSAVDAHVALVTSSVTAAKIRAAAIELASLPKAALAMSDDARLDCPLLPQPEGVRRAVVNLRGRGRGSASSGRFGGLHGPISDLLVWRRLLRIPGSFVLHTASGRDTFYANQRDDDPSSSSGEGVFEPESRGSSVVSTRLPVVEAAGVTAAQVAVPSSSAHAHAPDVAASSAIVGAAMTLQYHQLAHAAAAALQMSQASAAYHLAGYQYALAHSADKHAVSRRSRSRGRSSGRDRRRRRKRGRGESQDSDNWGGSEWEDDTSGYSRSRSR